MTASKNDKLLRKIEAARFDYGLSVSGMVKVLDTTRESYYSWRNGVTMHPSTSERVSGRLMQLHKLKIDINTLGWMSLTAKQRERKVLAAIRKAK